MCEENLENLKLSRDLRTKLERLELMFEQPQLFLAEYFATIRNEIDLNTEQLIHESMSLKSEDSAAKVNEMNTTRFEHIEFLDKLEQSLHTKLTETPGRLTCDSLSSLKNRVEHFSSLKGNVNEVYLQLAFDIIDATNELERRLLHGQTVAHLPLEHKMGNLVYLSEDYLNQNERDRLKYSFEKSSNMYQHKSNHRSVFEGLQALANNSLAVEVCYPFDVTRNMIIITSIISAHHYRPHDQTGKVFYLDGSSRTPSDFNQNMICQEFSLTIGYLLSCNGRYLNLADDFVESMSLGGLKVGDSETTGIQLMQNRLRSFQIDVSFMQKLIELDLSNNQLEALDEELLAKGINLEKLVLTNSCLPDTKFSLGFLNSLAKLKMLELTLPNAPVDFSVFEHLTCLKSLELYSATSLDSSIARPELSNEQFKQLAPRRWLSSVLLSHFEIVSLDRATLLEFGYVDLIECSLSESNKSKVDLDLFYWGDAFLRSNSFLIRNNSSDRRQVVRDSCDLNYNRIKQPPSEISTIQDYIHLDHNFIRRIKRGVFDNLTLLQELRLDYNFIDSIESGAFEALATLKELTLENCQLKSVDNTMFKGLTELRKLNLSDNEIETFKVVVSESADETVVKGILSPAEYELVRENFVCGMPKLQKLFLNGNNLEKLDLNIFCNFSELALLDLSSNLISELNQEIRPGVLSNLIMLNLRDNQLTRVDRRAFSESRHLRDLILAENRLESLDLEFFHSFDGLQYINLESNELSITITERTFVRCTRLHEINLLGNPCVRIEDNALSALSMLERIRIELQQADSQSSERFLEQMESNSCFDEVQRLSLVNSSLERFHSFRPEKNCKLVELDFSKNCIRDLKRYMFDGLPCLTSLDLSENLIEIIDEPNALECLANLEEINLHGNKLKNLHRQLFGGLHNLRSLDLSSNPTLVNLDAGLFQGLLNLRKLNLRQNNIASFDLASLFRSCRLLECLDLSNNQLDHKSINEASMSGITAQNLKELMLANNRLERMDFVRNLYRLEKLDLSGNKIESVTCDGVNLLGRLVKLEHVNLSNNRIESLNVKAAFSHLKSQLKFLDLSNNPFDLSTSNRSFTNCYAFIEKYKV